MPDQADISLVVRGVINYTIVRGDTFAPPPVEFLLNDAAVDFTGATLTMTIRKGDRVLFTLTDGAGIAVSGGQLQYTISADDLEGAYITRGDHRYDVQKDISSVRTTIQSGIITVIDDVTKQS